MEWIKITDAAKLVNKPARTVRHHALLGKLRAKKNGKDWFVDMNSLREQGWIAVKEKTQTQQSQIGQPQFESHLSDENLPQEGLEKKKSSPKDVRSLGVYKELLQFSQSDEFLNSTNDKGNDKSFEKIENTLACLAMGYFEFEYSSKLLEYKNARRHLLRFLVILHMNEAAIKKIEKNTDNKKNHLEKKLTTVSSVLLGLGGLIRKTEMKSNERITRSQRAASHFKNRESAD